MGSKRKFWYSNQMGERWLFKFGRASRGEDWSEKLASELADAIGIPHAIVELATREGLHGTISKAFETPDYELIHGNELLTVLVEGYPKDAPRSPQHRLSQVLDTLDHLEIRRPPTLAEVPGIISGTDVFIGYLMLDALIGNTDRHHENWGALRPVSAHDDAPQMLLAPTYDHAASLGRDLTAEVMQRRLETADSGFSVAHYAARARSKLHHSDGSPLTTLDAFDSAMRAYPLAGAAWLERLQGLEKEWIERTVRLVPEGRLASRPGASICGRSPNVQPKPTPLAPLASNALPRTLQSDLTFRRVAGSSLSRLLPDRPIADCGGRRGVRVPLHTGRGAGSRSRLSSTDRSRRPARNPYLPPTVPSLRQPSALNAPGGSSRVSRVIRA